MVLDHKWTEDTAELYRKLASIVVPHRKLQMATILSLIPFKRDESFRVVELASGEGRLSYAILAAYPNASVLALDYSTSMQDETRQRLSKFGNRGEVDFFDMESPDWYPYLDNADCVVSSLCIHHLMSDAKQKLFKEVSERISQRGTFIIADLVKPQRGEGWSLFANQLDQSVRSQSIEITGSQQGFHMFEEVQWNYYRYPDPIDQPDPLYDQLEWLRDAGLVDVDCFWMEAGHAIFGGYKSAEQEEVKHRLSYSDAMRCARQASIA